MKNKKPVNYINNAKLYGVMQAFHAASKQAKKNNEEMPKIPEYVGECFLLICGKLATRGNFGSYTYRDEMVSDGIENCVAAVHSFDPNKSKNPFAYFTQIAWYAFIRRIAKEKKQTYIKHKNFENNDILYDLINEFGDPQTTNEYSHDVIKTFEDKMPKPKKKAKKKGLEKFTE